MEWMLLMLKPAYFVTDDMSLGECQRLWADAQESGMSDHDIIRLMDCVCKLNHYGETAA